MKKYLLSLLPIFMVAICCQCLVSCGDGDDDENVVNYATSLDTPKYESVSARFDVTSTDSDIKSIELTESGDYIITKSTYYSSYSISKAKRAKGTASFLAKSSISSRATFYDNYTVYGKYTKISDTEFLLDGWGKITITGSTDNALSITVTPNSGNTYTVPVAKHTQNANSTLTSQVCRTWTITSFKVEGKEYSASEFSKVINNIIRQKYAYIDDYIEYFDEFDLPTTVIFTKAGTYMCIYGDGILDVGTWTWENEQRGEMRYSWNYEDMYDEEDSGDINVNFRGNQLVMSETTHDITIHITYYMDETK